MEGEGTKIKRSAEKLKMEPQPGNMCLHIIIEWA